MLGRRGIFAAMAAALMGVGTSPMILERAPIGGFGYSHNPMTYGQRGAGITMAQQQRASRRARNVKRHKRAVRG